MSGARLPVIPENITVHLGPASSAAPNVTVPFSQYIKNVASSEIYPTWPESAIRANILAQISFALNRIYTEYYRSRGYDFDITNSTAQDQSYIEGRDIFENISQIVDEIFSTYIARQGNVEPLFATYCDGVEVRCSGLSQWGSVSLAKRGLTPYEILQNYYGNNINLIDDAEIGGVEESYPGRTLQLGSAGDEVRFIQERLNRISKNYPNIPNISNPIGRFNTETENAVKAFQQTFDLTPDGIVGRATWYKILRVYTAVKRLADIDSEGLTLEDVTRYFDDTLALGSTGPGVRELQYFLRFISEFESTVPTVRFDGIFGAETENAVRAFQSLYGLPVTGVVDTDTWVTLYRAYLGMLDALPEGYFAYAKPYPGYPLVRGQQGSEVALLQEYLNFISDTYTEIPKLNEDGIFGPATENAVKAYQRIFGLNPNGIVAAATWSAIADTYNDLMLQNEARRESENEG